MRLMPTPSVIVTVDFKIVTAIKHAIYLKDGVVGAENIFYRIKTMFSVIANVFIREIRSIVNLIYLKTTSDIAIIVFYTACNLCGIVDLEALDNPGKVGMVFLPPIIWKAC